MAPAPASPRWASAPAALLIITLVGLLSRVVTFGNPVAIIDDQFYHYVGHAMLQGQWPYVDVWDRKPIGLFLIFAGIAAVGGGSVLVMQLIATAFAIATAWIIRHIALGFANAQGALLAALAYLVTLPLFGGQTGQSPIFYNLLIVSAAALLFGATRAEARGVAKRALGAMLLCGVAMIVKQTTVVEGAFFGLSFLWLAYRRSMAPVRLVLLATAMIAIALAPSAIALGIYAARGSEALDAYWFANYVSIFLKKAHGFKARAAGFLFFLLYIPPLAGAAIAGAVIRRREGPSDETRTLLFGWMIAALVGYLSVPNFFDHYVLPMLPPLAISGATFLGRPFGRIYFGALLIFSLIQGAMLDLGFNRREQAKFERADAAIARAAHGGCLFIANGPSQFFFTTPPCPTTRYIFPDHLTTFVETTGIGVDQSAELARVLAARPAVIVMIDNESDERKIALDRQLYETLLADYRSSFFLPDEQGPGLMQTLRVWQRKDLPAVR